MKTETASLTSRLCLGCWGKKQHLPHHIAMTTHVHQYRVQTSVRRATSRAGDCSAAVLSMASNWRRGRELELPPSLSSRRTHLLAEVWQEELSFLLPHLFLAVLLQAMRQYHHSQHTPFPSPSPPSPARCREEPPECSLWQEEPVPTASRAEPPALGPAPGSLLAWSAVK